MDSPVETDVVVIGAGLSGLVTAAELEAAGHQVLLLDGEPAAGLGGQAWWSFGGLLMVDTPEQRRLGIRDSAELALSDWLGSAAFDRPSDHWPRRWAEEFVGFAAGELRSWLRGRGIGWFPVVQWAERGGYPAGDGPAGAGHGNSVPRFHVTWGTGPALVQPFLAQLRESSRVRILDRHLVDGLDVGPDGVTVAGALLAPSTVPRGAPSSREPVGRFMVRGAAAVVAGGGIGGNHDLVRACWPADWGDPPAELLTGVPGYVDGALLGVAASAGGRLIHPDRMWHYPEGVANHSPVWERHGIRILPGPSSLWLDPDGHRLPPPLFPGFDALGALRELSRAGHAYSWFVADLATVGTEFALSGSEQNADLTGKDLRLLASRVRHGPTPEVRRFLDRGEDFLAADIVADLAAAMNTLTGDRRIDPGRLRSLLETRDLQLTAGLGKDPQLVAVAGARRYLGDRLTRVVGPHPLLDPSRPGQGRASRQHGPLVAVRLRVLTRKTLGGLETDLDGRVLRADGSAVPGLYAVGEAAGFGGGGMHGYRALEGTFLGGCLHSGRRVGRALAATLAG